MPPRKLTPSPTELYEPVNSKEELLKKIQDCLIEYNGEQNIPHGHDYWVWLNQYRYLRSL